MRPSPVSAAFILGQTVLVQLCQAGTTHLSLLSLKKPGPSQLHLSCSGCPIGVRRSTGEHGRLSECDHYGRASAFWVSGKNSRTSKVYPMSDFLRGPVTIILSSPPLEPLTLDASCP